MTSDVKKRGLGRGLAALLTNTSGEPAGAEAALEAAASAATPDLAAGVRMLEVTRISPNPHQPRTRFDETTLAELTESIRSHGIIQPLIVTVAPPASHRDAGTGASLAAEPAATYWIVAGERRWRAAQRAGLVQVPVIVRDTTSQQLMELALVENLQRDDLNPLEEATAYQALMDEFGLTQAEVAERVGKSRPAVANTVRLLALPAVVQAAVVEERISAGHARPLLALPDAAAMEATLAKILSHDLSVRQTEQLVKQLTAAPPPAAGTATEPAADPDLETHLQNLESQFRRALGTKVSLTRNHDGSGRLVIHFFNDDDLDSIYRLIAGEAD